MLVKILKWLCFGWAALPPADKRVDGMLTMLYYINRLAKQISNESWKGRQPHWRLTQVSSVHSNIYYLLHTVRHTTLSVMSRTKPSVETRLSRRVADNLTTVSLDSYLTDDHGMTCPPQVVMMELAVATRELVNNIRELEKTDEDYYDYYLRQCSNLFTELEIITKAYL